MIDFKILKTEFPIVVPALLCMGIGACFVLSWNLLFHELIYDAVSLYFAVVVSVLLLFGLFFAKFRIIIMRLSSSISFTGFIYILGVILGMYAIIKGWNSYTKRYIFDYNLYVPLWLLVGTLPLIFRIAFTSPTKSMFSRWMLFCIPPIILLSLLGDFPTLLLFVMMVVPVALLSGKIKATITISVLITAIGLVFLFSSSGQRMLRDYLLKKQQYHHNVQKRLAPEYENHLTRQYSDLIHLLKRDSLVAIYSRYNCCGLALISSVYMLLIAGILAQGIRNRSYPQVLAVHYAGTIFFFVPMAMALFNTLSKPLFPSLFLPMTCLDWNPVAVSTVLLMVITGWKQIASERIHHGNGVVKVAGNVEFSIVPNFFLHIDVAAATTEKADCLCTIPQPSEEVPKKIGCTKEVTS